MSALQIVNTNIIIHFFFFIERSVDSRMLIAIGGQDELAEDAVAIHHIGRVEGDGIIAMLRDVELEGLLLQVAEAVGGHIADVDGRRVGLLGNAHAARAILDVQLHGRGLGLVPVAYLVFQRVVAGSQRDRRTAVWLALNAIKRFVKSPFKTEFFAEQSDQRSSVARLIGRTSCQKASWQKPSTWVSTKVLRSAGKT